MNAVDTWLVLGASSAIARAFAHEAAAQGCDVILAGRDKADLEASAADIALRSGRRVRRVAASISRSFFSATASNSSRLRCRPAANNGLRQKISRSPG